MRRRLMGSSGLAVRKIEHDNVAPGDAVFYDASAGAMVYYRLGEGSESIPESCTPIGVVVIPSSHNVYGNGACGVMSLVPMSCDTPATGGTSEQGMCWGVVGDDISSLKDLNHVPFVGKAESLGDVDSTIVGYEYYAFLPSDYFTAAQCPHNTNVYWKTIEEGFPHAPSPFLTDGSRNPSYYQTASPSSTSSAIADFDGRGNSDIIVAQRGTKDYSSWLPEVSTGIDYPAASCCNMFYTDGTKQGDWYLPACGEFGYVLSVSKKINQAIGVINKTYGVGILINTDWAYWCSSEYNNNIARYIVAGHGGVDCYWNKDYLYPVRAFIQIGGKEKNYGPIHISGGTATDIPASGGSSQATGYTYSQTWGWGDSTTDGGVITEGAEVSVSSVSADSLGTTIKNRTKVGTSTVTVSLNGQTASMDMDVYQQANYVKEVVPSGIDGNTHFFYGTIAGAAGGTLTPTANGQATYTFTSGEQVTASNKGWNSDGTTTFARTYSGTLSAGFTKIDASTGAVTVSGRGSDIGAARGQTVNSVLTVTFVHGSSYTDGGTVSGSITQSAGCSQDGNFVTAVTANSNTFSYSNIGAGATSATPSTSHSPKFTFSSGSTSTTVPSSTYGSLATSCTYSLASSQNGFTAVNSSTGVLTATSCGTTPTSARASATVTKTLKYTWNPASGYGSSVNSGNLTKTATCTQNANTATYGAVSVTSHGSASDIPASGGTVSASGGKGSQTVSFSSGASRAGTVTCGSYSGVSASSLGTTVKSRTAIGTSSATLTGEGGKTATASVTVYQQANAETSITYGNPSVSLSYGNKNAAKGTVSPSYSYSQSREQYYTSGGHKALSALTSGGSLSFSETTAHANASVASGTGVVTWDANQSTSNRSVGITLKVTMNGKSGSKAATSTQLADAVSGTTWGNVSAGTITNATVPASGGTKTATAGNGSQSYTQTWVSGRTTTGTNSVAPSVASISATGSNLGTTVKAAATLKSQAVTWSGSGSKSASGTMYVYQQANAVKSSSTTNQTKSLSVSARYDGGSYVYDSLAAPNWIGKASATVHFSYSFTYKTTNTYTSGQSSDSTGSESVALSISSNGASASLSGNVLTVPDNTTTNVRSVTVQAKGQTTGATSSITIQQMGIDSVYVKNTANSSLKIGIIKDGNYSSYYNSWWSAYLEGRYTRNYIVLKSVNDTVNVYYNNGETSTKGPAIALNVAVTTSANKNVTIDLALLNQYGGILIE